MKKRFYRIGNINTNQGLWYDMDGNFTGLIHDTFSFCKNSNLLMPFDSNIQGYLSTVENINDIFSWFTKDDIEKLYPFGFRILEYEALDYKMHNGHWVINQNTSKLIKVLN